MCKSPRHGFTLIEIAIVLVIIGLIIGGVLVGRDLIHAAEIRATIKQLEDFNTAVNAFKTKYNCLPGDCAASTFGLGTTIDDGDAKGTIGPCLIGCFDQAIYANDIHEYINFWYHLGMAGLLSSSFQSFDALETADPSLSNAIAGVATPAPKIKALISGYGWMVKAGMTLHTSPAVLDEHILSSHTLLLGSSVLGFDMASDFRYAYHPSDSEAIDRKIDDGWPLTGIMQIYGFGPSSATSGSVVHTRQLLSCASAIQQCVCDEGSGVFPYNIKRQFTTATQRGCPIVIKATF